MILAVDETPGFSGAAGFVPTLKVTLQRRRGVEIRVRDNGTGIPGDIGDKLSQPFFTTKPTGEALWTARSANTAFTIRLPRNP